MIPLSAIVEEFEQGAWVADCEFAQVSDGTLALGSETWTGTVVSSRLEGGRYLTRIVGGKGGLGKPVTDKQYRGAVSVGKVFQDILTLAGETLGPALNDRVDNYDRMKGTAGQSLDMLAYVFGCSWRATRSGVMTLYRPASSSELDVKKYVRVGADIDGAAFLSVQDSAAVTMGQTFEGKRIRSIRWVLSKSRLVAEVSPDPVAAGDVRARLDFLKVYSAKVVKQNSDCSVDVIAAGRFGLSQVPLLVGIPVAKVTMLEGDLVNVGFYDGDPRKPYALCTAQGEGAKAVARVGDTADCGTLIIGQNASTFVVAPVYVPPGPNHDKLVPLAISTLASSGTPDVTGGGLALKALITSGQDRVRL